MLKHFFKITIRNLWQNKGFSFLNIAGMSVGMSVAMLIGLWLKDEFTFNHFHEKYDQIYQVYLTDYLEGGKKTVTWPSVPLPLAEKLRNDYPEIKYAAEMDWGWQHSLVVGDKRFFKRGIQTDNDFLKIFSFDLLEGDQQTALLDPQSIVLTESMAEAIFDKEDAMGKVIRVDDRVDVTVTGIVKDPPDNSTLDFNFILPFGGWESWANWVTESRSNWSNNSFQLFIAVEEGTNEAGLAAKIKGIVQANKKNSTAEVVIHPMKKWRLYSEWENGKAENGFIEYVRLFGIIGLFVLLIACINFMNLSTARSEKRAKEVGIRKTVGSGRWQLIGQFLSEAVLMSVLAFIISMLLVSLSLPWFNELTAKEMTVPFSNPVFLMVTLGFVLLTGFMAGSYPAFFLSGFKPIGVLKGMTNKLGGNRFRQILVISQFTISVALIIGTIVIWQQIDHVRQRPNGYDSNRLAMVFSSQDLIDNYEIVKSEMLTSGAVESVTRASSPITAIYANNMNVHWPGKGADDEVLFATVATSWDYTKTLGIKMLEGRDFSEEMKTDSSAVIFNKAAIERMGLENPIGQQIKWQDDELTIIGVMDNVIMNSPYEPVQPAMLVCVPDWIDQIMFRIAPNIATEDALARLEPIFEKHNPSYPFEYQFADEQYAKKFSRIKMIGTMALMFGGLAIFISCLGLFGLAAFMAERRVKEIGIRKVLGATILNIWSMLSKDFLMLVIISSVLAGPLAAYFLSDWLQQYEYRIEMNWWVFVAAIALAILVTLLTVSFQSIKAALANPVQSLKSE